MNKAVGIFCPVVDPDMVDGLLVRVWRPEHMASKDMPNSDHDREYATLKVRFEFDNFIVSTVSCSMP